MRVCCRYRKRRASSEPRAVLGNRRLSIIDIAGGHQPLGNEDGSIWTVQNGEIYNFQELRERLEATGHRFATRSDTEIIVHLYEEMGEQFARELDGMFAIALWDDRKKKLVLARDRFGKKPVLYAEAGGPLVVRIRVPGLARRSGDHARDRLRSARRIPVVHVGAGAADDLQADTKVAAGARAGPRYIGHAPRALLVARVHTEDAASARTKRPRKCGGS